MAQETVKNLMPALLTRIGLSPENFAILSVAEKEISALIPSSRIVGFKNNKIFVEVDSSVQMNELHLRKRKILKTLAGAFGKNHAVHAADIRFFLKGQARPSFAERLKSRPGS